MQYEPYIQVRSGSKFHFLDPQPEEILIEDIAFALSNLTRFNGHVPFYSVAEHSVFVSHRCQTLGALLHDAAEAYLSDIPSPIKQYLPEFQKMEDRILKVIMDKFDCEYSNEVKWADKYQTYVEAKCLLPDGGKDWVPNTVVVDPSFIPLSLTPDEAYEWFMKRFNELYGK